MESGPRPLARSSTGTSSISPSRKQPKALRFPKYGFVDRGYSSVLQKTAIAYNSGMAGISFRKVERIVKGYANHRRIQILDLLKREPELSVDEISELVGIGYENASDHVRKLAIAGLVLKRNEGPR